MTSHLLKGHLPKSHAHARRRPARPALERSLLRSPQSGTGGLLGLLAVAVALTACGSGHDHTQPDEPKASATGDDHEAHRHIDLPPSVLDNLGITLTEVTTGRLQHWVEVPGELLAPTHRRYPLATPAHAHVVWLADPWTAVEAGDTVARLHSPELSLAKSELVGANRQLERATAEHLATADRLTRSKSLIAATEANAQRAVGRAAELLDLMERGGSIARQEYFAASHAANRAESDLLDALSRRDALISELSLKDQEIEQAGFEIERALHELGILTALEPIELLESVDGKPRWRGLDEIALRAPHDGVVVAVDTAIGLPVDHGDPIVTVLDPSVLHFHGALPESELGRLHSDPVCELRIRGFDRTFEALWIGPIPVADSRTRSLQIEAAVSNADRLLADGLSAVLRVQVPSEIDATTGDQVLIPTTAVARDGLVSVAFRRELDDPDEFAPVPLRLGRQVDGSVEVLSGLEAGDTIVESGVRQVLRALKEQEAGGGGGGHMHADGTWHEDH